MGIDVEGLDKANNMTVEVQMIKLKKLYRTQLS